MSDRDCNPPHLGPGGSDDDGDEVSSLLLDGSQGYAQMRVFKVVIGALAGVSLLVAFLTKPWLFAPKTGLGSQQEVLSAEKASNDAQSQDLELIDDFTFFGASLTTRSTTTDPSALGLGLGLGIGIPVLGLGLGLGIGLPNGPESQPEPPCEWPLLPGFGCRPPGKWSLQPCQNAGVCGTEPGSYCLEINEVGQPRVEPFVCLCEVGYECTSSCDEPSEPKNCTPSTTTTTTGKQQDVCSGANNALCCIPFPGTEVGQWTTSAGGGTWEESDGRLTFRIADDVLCGGAVSQVQTGTATLQLTLTSKETLRLSAQGLGEDEYENMHVKVDGSEVLVLQCSYIEGVCIVNTCDMCPVKQKAVEVSLAPGEHTIVVTATTVDGFYHTGAFFTLFLSKKGSCASECQCPL